MVSVCFSPAPVCFITGPDNSTVDIGKTVSLILESGIKWVQYREKNRTRKELFYTALKLREITRRYNACFIVNDYADIALATDADGVHLGQDDLPLREARKIMGNRIIGISTHNVPEAVEAESGGADYIGFGAIFHTITKAVGNPRGTSALREVKESVKIPVIAIGGITADNLKSVMDTGCAGVAVSSGLTNGDIKVNVKRFLSVMHHEV